MNEDRKLFEALGTLKDICSRYGKCEECPLVTKNEDCGIQYGPPESWTINEPPPLKYRAFKE